MVNHINWTEILSKNNLESPGYHEAVAAANAHTAQKAAMKQEALQAKATKKGVRSKRKSR